MKYWIISLAFITHFFWATFAYAQSTIVYQDNFEGGASGWSNNSTDFDPDTTTFLGPFDVNSNSTSRTFAVPAGSDRLVIEFDFYRFDSWDDNAQFGFDRFQIEVDGNQLFSLPFPNPQGTRSGTVGNVDWVHTPSTGTVELAYMTGQFWFDQVHRYVVTVNNPGSTVSLNLISNLTQAVFDEAGGYDNFLVTAFPPPGTEITAVAENFATIDGDSGGVTTSVLASDTYNNQPATLNDVTLSLVNASSPNVVLDPQTGLITVAPGTAAGFYTVAYEICETSAPANCSSVTETITVNVSIPGGGGGFCPIGATAIPGTFHAVSASGGQNTNLAVGQPVAEGTTLTNSAVTFFGPITLDLTGDPNILAPEGEVIDVVLSSHFGTQGRAEILMSVDGITYTSLGTTGNGGSVYGAWTSNVMRYDDFVVPAGGARFLQVFQQNSGVRVDGVIYGTQCSGGAAPISVTAVVDSETVTSLAAAQPNILNVLDNDAFDGAAPSNFDLAVTAGSSLPSELTFDTLTGAVGVAAGTAAGVYSFDYDICEAGTTNCETATVTITVDATPNRGGGGGICPVGATTIPGTFHAVSASGGQNTNLAVGQPVAEGTTLTNSAVTFFGPITLDLTGDPDILAPEGEVIDVVLSSHFGTQGRAEILMSVDGNTYTSLGTAGNGGSVHGAWTSNVMRYDDFIVPAGGARFLQVLHQNSGVRVDGVIYGTQCSGGAAPIAVTAVDDSETVTSLAAAQPNILNVLDNDAFDGAAPSNFGLAVTAGSSLPPELTFDTATGAVGVAAGTAAGVYSFEYDICEAGTTNCETVTVTITVEATPILAVAESFTAIGGIAGGVTTSVLTSDTLDGAAASLNNVTISAITSSSINVVLDAGTGIITVAANTAAGTYTVEYTICEDLNPANCSTVTETVTVTVPAASLAMTKTAGNPGPYKAGEIVTYTYTVTNTGGQAIRNVAITDTHNGSGPAPVPNNEALLTDAAPLGDSTDTAVDGNWEVLGPGDVITFTGTYTLTQIDVDNL